MKKVVAIFILIVMIMGVATVVRATTSDELADKLYEMGSPYGLTTTEKLKVERYLADNPISEEKANQIVAKAEEVIQVFKDAGVTNYSKLSKAQADKVKSIANETASIVGLTLKFKTREVEIYKDGKLIESARYDGTKLTYTGNNVNTVLVVSAVVILALVAGFALRKKFVNA